MLTNDDIILYAVNLTDKPISCEFRTPIDCNAIFKIYDNEFETSFMFTPESNDDDKLEMVKGLVNDFVACHYLLN